MAIKLSNFVDITIKKSTAVSTTYAKDTAVLYYSSTAEDDDSIVTTIKDLEGYDDGEITLSAEPDDCTSSYISIFFDNGGVKLHLIPVGTKAISELDRNEIVVGITKAASSKLPEGWGETTEADGPLQKIFVQGTSESTISDGVEGMVYKHCGSADDWGAISTILAYTTNIQYYNADVCADYAFTVEDVPEEYIPSDATVDAIVKGGTVNCDAYLAGSIRNVGGNDASGEEMINLWFRIVVQQCLQDRLLSALSNKIRYNNAGINTINGVIVDELAHFVTNGYISTTQTWSANDLYIDGDLVIAKGSTLTSGYAVHISPLSTLSDDERKAHQFPKIYILFADTYTIRKIVVNGEVF